jgi:4a-hydroxytetrahydrobiopterin dehydratase
MAATQCELASRHCEPCEGGTPTLDAAAVASRLKQIDSEWSVDTTGRSIERDFRFKGFHKTMSFVNAVAWIANREMHHPDLQVGYGHCRITLTTHAIDGLSENDFILAARIDELLD